MPDRRTLQKKAEEVKDRHTIPTTKACRSSEVLTKRIVVHPVNAGTHPCASLITQGKEQVPMHTPKIFSIGLMLLMSTAFITSCGKDHHGNSGGAPGGVLAPIVVSTSPANSATAVATNSNVIARFSKAMTAATINAVTFAVTGPGTTAVPGTVSYDAINFVADFLPSAPLAASTLFTATVTAGAKDSAGNPMQADYVWTFTTGTTADTTAPTVTSTSPADLATGVPINQIISAVFSEQMDSSTLTTTSFTLMNGLVAVPGSVMCPGTTASFKPAANLAPSTTFTARITTVARDLADNPMAADYVWTFQTGTVAAAGPASVNLGTAANYVILAKSGVSTTGVTAVTGNIGLSPAADTALTGFGETLDGSGVFSTSALVTGRLYASNYAPPTPSDLTTAVLDMQTAYTDAAGRLLPDATDLGGGNINGMTLVPGLYKWGTGLSFSTGITLAGGANDVWIFQIGQDLTVGNGAIVTLTGGALPKNIFWQVAGQTSLGTTADFKGVILCKTLIAINTGATVLGRAMAQTAVTLNANSITAP